ncbi:phage distal tail protein [Clostridium cylindrosporum]|uniref:Phage tail protein n=1 Tax=Clostridium cylindrosporum DSM 605 TaxID=1121307 RepID=A0A0J8D679_CLOCY|nr:phage tail domain-containing protein [Clostridium cylindrosporum]KMT21600.1 phage tail protein [Clostridium cylindrosporum DSM 605]
MYTTIAIINEIKKNYVTINTYLKGDTGIVLTSFEDNQLKGEVSTVKGINQYGTTITTTTLGNRDIDMQGVIIANNRKEIEIIKRDLIATLNPLDDIVIKYTDDNINKEIQARASSVPMFDSNYKLNSECLLGFKVSFDCYSPFWQDTEKTIVNIGTWLDKFEFPFMLDDTAGIEFGTKGPNEIEFINNGDVDAALEVVFIGPALNPKVTLSDNEFIKVNKNILDQEMLYISTAYGNKRVEITKADGAIENAYNYIDIFSSFFNLKEGYNKITYSTEDNSVPQNVFIKYKNQYLSL